MLFLKGMTTKRETYIPFKFQDCPESGLTNVHCRSVESGVYKEFTLPKSQWLVVDPFRYPQESEEEKLSALETSFGTSHVYHDPSDRFLVKNYLLKNFQESDFKSIYRLPNKYTTKIAMNGKRFYNLFSDDAKWIDERGRSYKDLQDHHILVKRNPSGEYFFRRPSDESFTVLDKEIWDMLNDTIDIFFSEIPQHEFENDFSTKIAGSTDYAHIAYGWISENQSLDKWYTENIRDLYNLSFLSSRNISDIVKIETSKEWSLLTDDILLSTDLSLFDTSKITRFPTDYCQVGKYVNVFKYRIGDLLLYLMSQSTCRGTLDIWKKFKDLSKWNSVIANIFNYEKLNPQEFIFPESCVYIDNEYMFTTRQLEDITHVGFYDLVVIVSEGSYITYSMSSKSSSFHGIHPLCKPLFEAGKRCIEKYMVCLAKRIDIKPDSISELTDKTPESLRINITVTRNNINKYESLIPSEIVRSLDRREITDIEVPMWLGKNMTELVNVYDPVNTVKSSNQYLDHLMHLMDKIR